MPSYCPTPTQATPNTHCPVCAAWQLLDSIALQNWLACEAVSTCVRVSHTLLCVWCLCHSSYVRFDLTGRCALMRLYIAHLASSPVVFIYFPLLLRLRFHEIVIRSSLIANTCNIFPPHGPTPVFVSRFFEK